MKKVVGVGLGLIVLLGAVFVLQLVASESGEVVVLRVTDGADVQETRLWVVDVAGEQYLRAGHAGAGWYAATVAAASVEVERNGVASSYAALPAPEMRAEVAQAMLDKYAWRERFISLLVGGREGAMPIRLVATP